MAGKVISCSKEKYDVYIGKNSKWENPFFIEPSSKKFDVKYLASNPREVLEKYVEWFLNKAHLVADAKKELKNKTLGCWCNQELCHGKFLVQFVDKVDYISTEVPKTLHPK